MIRLICPGCEKVLKVPETMAGKVGTCPGCKSQFTAPEASPEEEADEFPVEDEEDRPKRSRKAQRDDDDDEDRPKSSRKRRRDDDYDDEEEDEPRPKRRKKKRKRAASGGFLDWYLTFPGRLLDIAAITAVLVLLSLFIQSGAGAVLLILWALALSTIGSIWFAIVTLNDSVGEFLLCLFIPCYSLYYLITHFEDVKRPFFIQLFSIVPILVAMVLVAKKGFELKM